MRKIVLSNSQATGFLLTLIVILILIIFSFSKIVYGYYMKYNYAMENVEIYSLNKESVFRIKKITYFTSVDAKDNTTDNSMKNINVSLYTDIAIEIDNTSFQSELNNRNTVKSISIENIKIISDEVDGIKSLTYKNPNNFGKYEETKASNSYSKDNQDFANIYFDAVYTNDNIDYNNPTFYTDCSNPICLTYLNKDIISNLSVPDNTNIDLNGQLLKHLNYPTSTLETILEFNIVIVNNDDEEFTYLVKLDIDPDSDLDLSVSGYSYQGRESSDTSEYVFYQYK